MPQRRSKWMRISTSNSMWIVVTTNSDPYGKMTGGGGFHNDFRYVKNWACFS